MFFSYFGECKLGKYRTRLQIIADILSVVSNGPKKTHIMYQANLSYKLLSRYLTEVMKAGLVSFKDEDCYGLTNKGQEFLDRFGEYSKRCKHLEEHLNDVNNEKMVLQRMIISDSNSRPDEQ